MKISNKKKAQTALEFLILFSFLLGILSIISYVFFDYLYQSEQDKKIDEINSFGNYILSEANLASNSEEGYIRILNITNKNFDINITKNTLILNYFNLKSKKYYFDLPKINNITYNNNSNTIYFEK